MSALSSSMSVKPPAENAAITAARAQEQARADAAFVTNTQSLEQEELRRKARRLGGRVTSATSGAVAPGAAGLGADGSQATPGIDYGNLGVGFGEGFGTLGAGAFGGGQVGFL